MLAISHHPLISAALNVLYLDKRMKDNPIFQILNT